MFPLIFDKIWHVLHTVLHLTYVDPRFAESGLFTAHLQNPGINPTACTAQVSGAAAAAEPPVAKRDGERGAAAATRQAAAAAQHAAEPIRQCDVQEAIKESLAGSLVSHALSEIQLAVDSARENRFNGISVRTSALLMEKNCSLGIRIFGVDFCRVLALK